MLNWDGRRQLASAPDIAVADPVCLAPASTERAGPGRVVRTLLMLARPRTCVPGLLAFALGHAYTAGPALTAHVLLGALLAFSIGLSANLHNAATDLHEDAYNLPGRKILLVSVGYRSVLRVCVALGAVMFAGAVLLGAYFTVFMALALVGLHQYSAPPVRSKGRPVLGLWVFAQAVVFPFLFGWTTDPGKMLETLLASVAARFGAAAVPPDADAWQSWRYLGMWAFLTAWFMAKGTFKNVPDYDGDRAAGVRTSATVFASRHRAALVATAATVAAYLALGALVALEFEKPRLLLALGWLFPVAASCARLVRSKDGLEANAVLRGDMIISAGFVATVLLLIAPNGVNVAFVAVGALVLLASDRLGIDSRRTAEVQGAAARVLPIVEGPNA